MNLQLDGLKYKVKEMMESGEIRLLINQIRGDIASTFLQTEVQQKDVREDLYHTSRCLDLLERKLQEFVNEISIKENEE